MDQIIPFSIVHVKMFVSRLWRTYYDQTTNLTNRWTGSWLNRIMAYPLFGTGHNLNQCWLIVNQTLLAVKWRPYCIGPNMLILSLIRGCTLNTQCRYNAVQYNITGIEADYQSEAELTKNTPYLALTDELWGVFRGYFGENWPRYNGTALYFACCSTPCGIWHGAQHVYF